MKTVYENRYGGIKRDWLPNMVQPQWFLGTTTTTQLRVCARVYACALVGMCTHLSSRLYTETCHRVRDLIGDKSELP